MTFSEYQQRAMSTAIYPDKVGRLFEQCGEDLTGSSTQLFRLCYVSLGLGEAGEVQNKVKKIIRDHAGKTTLEMRVAIGKELGGLLWYIAAVAHEIGMGMEEVAQINLAELAGRMERGTLQGSGDNR